MLSTIVFEARKPHKVANLAIPIVPQDPESRSRRRGLYRDPHLARNQTCWGTPQSAKYCLAWSFCRWMSCRWSPHRNPIQNVTRSNHWVFWEASFVYVFVYECSTDLYHSGDFYHFPPVAAGFPADFGGIFCALCVCVFERVYVCNVVSWHIMLSNHI